MKVQEVSNIIAGLEALSQNKIPFKLSYRIARLRTKFVPEAKIIQDTITQMNIENGGEHNEYGGYTIKSPGKDASEKEVKKYLDSLKKYTDQVKEFNQTEVNIDFDKIPFSLFPEDLNLEPEILFALDFIIDHEAEESVDEDLPKQKEKTKKK